MTRPRRMGLPLKEIARRQTDLYAVEQSIANVPFLNGQLLESVRTQVGEKIVSEKIVLGTSEVKLWHNLGRVCRGYIIVSQDAPESIYKIEPTFPPQADEKERRGQEAQKNSVLILKATGTVTVKVWVF